MFCVGCCSFVFDFGGLVFAVFLWVGGLICVLVVVCLRLLLL